MTKQIAQQMPKRKNGLAELLNLDRNTLFAFDLFGGAYGSQRAWVPKGHWVPKDQWAPKGPSPEGPPWDPMGITLGSYRKPPWDPMGSPLGPQGTNSYQFF